jgi:hypothetical protein
MRQAKTPEKYKYIEILQEEKKLLCGGVRSPKESMALAQTIKQLRHLSEILCAPVQFTRKEEDE